MDVEGSPRTIITVPRKLVSVSVPYLSVGGYVGGPYHFPLGGTTIGVAVVFVVLDMASLVRFGRIQDWQTIIGNHQLRCRYM